MHERTPADDPSRQQLISLLTLDFTPPETAALVQQAEQDDDALGGLIANMRNIEDIDRRFASSENIGLGEQVAGLVATAPVTASFKEFIVGEVRRAHAWQSHVDEVVAPDRLGLTSGDGIFDPTRAKGIETRTMRGRVFDVLRRYTSVIPTGDASELPPLVLRPGRRPRDLAEAMDQLHTWEVDYEQTYDENPFEEVEAEAFIAAAPRAVVIDADEAEQSGWAQIIRRLNELRGNDEHA